MSNSSTELGGIYVIVNIMDGKAYVGQAQDFSKRDHVWNLFNGKDNKNLQEDFDNLSKKLEFVYFVVANSETKINKRKSKDRKLLDVYERLFMNIMEDLGFELYNTNIQRKDRALDVLGVTKERYQEAIDTLESDFKSRFGKGAKELINADEKTRREALEHYASLHLRHLTETTDRFFYHRNRIESILGSNEKSLLTLDIDLNEMYYSKVGNYVGEGIDQILHGKMQAINNGEYGYCLWAVATNAFSAATTRDLCRKRKEQGKDTYVLFSFTPSSEYASGESNEYPFLAKDDTKLLDSKELEFLKCVPVGKGIYEIPKDMRCTGASEKSAIAFVIQDFLLLNENITDNGLDKQYEFVDGSNNTNPFSEKGAQRNTVFLRCKKELDTESICTTADNRSICFIGKLASPYVVRLRSYNPNEI